MDDDTVQSEHSNRTSDTKASRKSRSGKHKGKGDQKSNDTNEGTMATESTPPERAKSKDKNKKSKSKSKTKKGKSKVQPVLEQQAHAPMGTEQESEGGANADVRASAKKVSKMHDVKTGDVHETQPPDLQREPEREHIPANKVEHQLSGPKEPADSVIEVANTANAVDLAGPRSMDLAKNASLEPNVRTAATATAIGKEDDGGEVRPVAPATAADSNSTPHSRTTDKDTHLRGHHHHRHEKGRETKEGGNVTEDSGIVGDDLGSEWTGSEFGSSDGDDYDSLDDLSGDEHGDDDEVSDDNHTHLSAEHHAEMKRYTDQVMGEAAEIESSWIPVTSSSVHAGRIFYYDTLTGLTQWEPPEEYAHLHSQMGGRQSSIAEDQQVVGVDNGGTQPRQHHANVPVFSVVRPLRSELRQRLEQNLHTLPHGMYHVMACHFFTTTFEESNGYSWDMVIAVKSPHFHKGKPAVKLGEAELDEDPVAYLCHRMHSCGMEVGIHQHVHSAEAIKGMSDEQRARLKAQRTASGPGKLPPVRLSHLHGGDVVFILVRCGVDRLKRAALDFQHRLELDPVKLKRKANFGSDQIPAFDIAPTPRAVTSVKVDPYEHHFIPYTDAEHAELLFKEAPGCDHPFDSADRAQLIHAVLFAPPHRGGCGFVEEELKEKGGVLAVFPFPNESLDGTGENQRGLFDDLRHTWTSATSPPWKIPVDQIHRYCGSATSLYHAVAAHIASWSLPIAVLGLYTSVEFYLMPQSFVVGRLVFPLVVAVWASSLVRAWNRKELWLGLRWGTLSLAYAADNEGAWDGLNESAAGVRRERSHVTGCQVLTADPKTRQTQRVVSAVTVAVCMGSLLILLVVLCAFLMISNDSRFRGQTSLHMCALFAVPVVHALLVSVLDTRYRHLAVWLTQRELHSTSTAHNDAAVSKVVAFTFANNFTAPLFLAFVRPFIDAPSSTVSLGPFSHTETLATYLGLTFAVRMVLATPCANLLKRATTKDDRNKVSASEEKSKSGAMPAQKGDSDAIENEFQLREYDVASDLFANYLELSLLFGYMVLFAAVLPAIVCAGSVVLWWRCKAAARELMWQCRRPVAKHASSIGAWKLVLQVTAALAVATNSGLVLFTMDVLPNLSLASRVWMFYGVQVAAFGVCTVFSLCDHGGVAGPAIELQLRRKDALVERIVDQVPPRDPWDFEALEGVATELNGADQQDGYLHQDRRDIT